MKNEWKEFYKKAALLQHSAELLASGEMITTYQRFATLPEGRRLLSVATDAQRIQRQQHFFNPPIAGRQRLGQGKHDRGEAILFANGAFLETDYQGVDNHMPARLKAISVLKKTVARGETWDVSVRGKQWGIDELEELYVTVNVGELVLEPGASIVIRGNVFSLLCQRLVCKGEGPEGDYHIGILPTPFSIDNKTGPLEGRHGSNGLNGQHGRDGKQAEISSSIIGYRLIAPITKEEMDGTNGTDGGPGENGTDGRNGGMCKIAEITIRALTGPCRIFSQAGQGGDGGNGGNGGHGGHGGTGAKGHRLVLHELPAGSHGKNGSGGPGGKGGHGGHGGLSSNIYVNVPPQNEKEVELVTLPSCGGRAGKAGEGGAAGHANIDAATRNPHIESNNGSPGKAGRDGRDRAQPWLFLNEQPISVPVTAGL
jgi:hypothetical protein